MFRRKTLSLGGCCSVILLALILSAWQRAASSAQQPAVADRAAGPGSPRQGAPIRPVARRPLGGDIAAETTVWDPFPTFNGITADAENNRVVMSDLNRHRTVQHDRMSCAS